MRKPKFIKLVSDTTFKYMWKKKVTREWFVEIIKDKTGIDLSNYYITDNEFNTGDILKDSRCDITLTDGINKVVIVEMQNRYSVSAMIKGLLYLFKSTGTLFEEGDDYNSESTTTLIMFNNFYNKTDRNVPVVTHEFKAVEIEHKYDFVKSYEIYLPVYYKLGYNNLNMIDKRIFLFRCRSYKEMYDVIDNPEDLRILKELEMLGMNRKFISEYDREKVNKKLMNSLRNEGILEGMTQGIEQEKVNIARSMKNDKVSVDSISKYTGLSVKQINSIKV